MKIKNILYATLFSASLLFQSCSLDEDTSGISSPDNFFRKYSECQSVVNSCYIPIKSIYTYTYMLATECVTDIAYCPSGSCISPKAVFSLMTTVSAVYASGSASVERSVMYHTSVTSSPGCKSRSSLSAMPESSMP